MEPHDEGRGDEPGPTAGRQAEEQVRMLWRAVEQSPSMVLITDTAGNIEYVNPKLVQVTGYMQGELIGGNPRILKSGRQPCEYYQTLWETISKGEEWQGELCNRKKNGESYWVNAAISPIRNAEGVVTHFIGIQEDITQRKADEEERERLFGELRRSEEALRELNASKDRLFSIISHDLRSPFTTLLGYCDLLQSDEFEWTVEETREYVRSIDMVARRTYSLIENLLEWSGVQTGRTERQPTTIGLSRIVSDAIEQSRQAAQAKEISLINGLEETRYALANPDMVASVMRNLLSNAVKFTRPGGAVRVSAREVGDFVEVAVTDNGIGISQEDAAILFRTDAHHTTRGTANERGTGLGLLLCKELVERNGGEIWLESEAGKGTTVRFTLPKEG